MSSSQPAEVVEAASPSVEQMNKRKPSVTFWILGILLFASIITLVSVLVSTPEAMAMIQRFVSTRMVTIRRLVSPYIPSKDRVIGMNQPISEKLFVKEARLTRPGFVILTQNPPQGSDEDILISATKINFVPEGRSFNIPVFIDLAYIETLGMGSGSTVYIALYYDDGDRVFDKDQDILVKNILGDPVLGHFVLE